MYVLIPVENGQPQGARSINNNNGANIKEGDFVRARTKIYKIISVLHGAVRTELYGVEATIDEVLKRNN